MGCPCGPLTNVDGTPQNFGILQDSNNIIFPQNLTKLHILNTNELIALWITFYYQNSILGLNQDQTFWSRFKPRIGFFYGMKEVSVSLDYPLSNLFVLD